MTGHAGDYHLPGKIRRRIAASRISEPSSRGFCFQQLDIWCFSFFFCGDGKGREETETDRQGYTHLTDISYSQSCLQSLHQQTEEKRDNNAHWCRTRQAETQKEKSLRRETVRGSKRKTVPVRPASRRTMLLLLLERRRLHVLFVIKSSLFQRCGT